jgi:D-beta-D-heptose 7-phosphate kinase/D-beta-D-heptose 1-phosphate adenosyltransferase
MGRVVDIDELLVIRERLREEGRGVVFTNGCFDIIHCGHVEYLNKAKQLGDVLVVGVNSDNSMRRIKGELRPIVPQEDRTLILSNLCSVDYVCVFEEDTPAHIISALVPDILVKGSDWSIDRIVGRDVVEAAGGKVMPIKLTPDHSTTNIIETILSRYCNR